MTWGSSQTEQDFAILCWIIPSLCCRLLRPFLTHCHNHTRCSWRPIVMLGHLGDLIVKGPHLSNYYVWLLWSSKNPPPLLPGVAAQLGLDLAWQGGHCVDTVPVSPRALFATCNDIVSFQCLQLKLTFLCITTSFINTFFFPSSVWAFVIWFWWPDCLRGRYSQLRRYNGHCGGIYKRLRCNSCFSIPIRASTK